MKSGLDCLTSILKLALVVLNITMTIRKKNKEKHPET